MSESLAAPNCLQSRGEELANSISHGIGLVAALVASPYLIVPAVQGEDLGFSVGVCLYSASMVFLYLSSTIYHALAVGKAKQAFQAIEHAAIFVLIAGTYTPFALGVLRGPWGWAVLAIIWSLALGGVALKAFRPVSYSFVSTSLYLSMGWLGVIAVVPLAGRVPASGLRWLVAGGLAYTAGVAFFVTDSRLRYGHFIWHLFVMAGTACHFVAVIRCAT